MAGPAADAEPCHDSPQRGVNDGVSRLVKNGGTQAGLEGARSLGIEDNAGKLFDPIAGEGMRRCVAVDFGASEAAGQP